MQQSEPEQDSEFVEETLEFVFEGFDQSTSAKGVVLKRIVEDNKSGGAQKISSSLVESQQQRVNEYDSLAFKSLNKFFRESFPD